VSGEGGPAIQAFPDMPEAHTEGPEAYVPANNPYQVVQGERVIRTRSIDPAFTKSPADLYRVQQTPGGGRT